MLLKKKLEDPNLTETERKELNARLAVLENNLNLYKSLLSTLITGEKTNYNELTEQQKKALNNTVIAINAEVAATAAAHASQANQPIIDTITGLDTTHTITPDVLDAMKDQLAATLGTTLTPLYTIYTYI